jgi:uncharacterized membrane-anchored protein
MPDILTSIHGRRLGLGRKGNLKTNRRDGGQRGDELTAVITSAQLLALNATPVEIIPAPAAGYAHVINRVQVHKPAGTAYAGIAAGEDLVLKYTDASGAQASSVIETTGFLDQTTAQTRVASFPASVSTTAGDVAPVSAAAIVAHLLTGEITTGNSPLYVTVSYDTILLADLG